MGLRSAVRTDEHLRSRLTNKTTWLLAWFGVCLTFLPAPGGCWVLLTGGPGQQARSARAATLQALLRRPARQRHDRAAGAGRPVRAGGISGGAGAAPGVLGPGCWAGGVGRVRAASLTLARGPVCRARSHDDGSGGPGLPGVRPLSLLRPSARCPALRDPGGLTGGWREPAAVWYLIGVMIGVLCPVASVAHGQPGLRPWPGRHRRARPGCGRRGGRSCGPRPGRRVCRPCVL